MLIPHPLLGLRDAQEFTYLGDAALIDRPDGLTPRASTASCGSTSRATAPGWSSPATP
jgi:sarcosine oxidase subunit delta